MKILKKIKDKSDKISLFFVFVYICFQKREKKQDMNSKKIVTSFGLLLVSSLSFMQAGTIILEGNYQGKNLYVQNPFSGTGVGFCTFEVKVNGNVTTDEINSSAFEIDLANFQMQVGDKLVIAIKHKDDCRPKVLNPEVLKSKSTFEIVDIKVSNGGLLDWSTKNESGKLPFMVEQFRWNKWIKIGEVEGKGTAVTNAYQFQVIPHSGENMFRVKQVDYSNEPNISKTARFRSVAEEVKLKSAKTSKMLEFTAETMYEIYDSYGNIVKKGFAATVDCENLKKGVYYVNYDNKTEEFIKK